jgi:DNA modification methylase
MSQKVIPQIDHAITPKTHPPMYYMHKYWARKPHNVVAKYIETYSLPNEIVMDPFSGSGVTPIESLKLGRRAVAVDLDPMSVFITRMTGVYVNIDEFENAFKLIKKTVKDKIYDLYKTRCNKCGKIGVLSHIVWRMTDSDFASEVPLEEWYYCDCRKDLQKKNFDEEDKTTLEKMSKMPIPYWVPDVELIWNTRINVHKGTRITDLFSHRNLIALSILFHSIDELPAGNVKDLMKFVFTGFVVKASRMNFVNVGGYKSLGRGWCVRGYWVPKEHMEQNVWNDYERQFNLVKKGKIESNREVKDFREADSFDDIQRGKGNILILNGSALGIPLPSDSVDYVFTDPPYGDSIPYLELHYMWSSWLKFDVNFDEEIIISDSPVRKNKNFEIYHKMLSKAFREVYRVLKPNKWLTVTFHNTDIKIYNSIIKAVILAGFDLEKIVYQPPAKPSAKGLLAPYGSAVGDYYIRFRKTEKESLGLAVYSEIDKERYEKIIVNTVKKIIGERGEPTSYSIIINSYPIIYDELKKSGYLFSAPEGIEEILKRNLNKEFVLVDIKDDKGEVIGQKWWLRGVLFLDRVPLSERVEAITVDILNREIKVSFDDVLQQVYLRFTNALTPDTQSIKEALEEYAEKTKDGKWRLKPKIKQRESEHDSMVEILAILGKKAGFEVYADLSGWRETLELPLLQENLDRIKEIDVIWYNKNEISYEFEVENTTGITEAIVRGSNIPSTKTKRYVVIPEERQNLFYRKISEPMLKERVEEYGWQFIFYDSLKTFYERNKRSKEIQISDFEKLAEILRLEVKKQQSIQEFLK